MKNKSILFLLITVLLCGCGKQIHSPQKNFFALRHDPLSSELVALVVPRYEIESVVLFGVTSYDLNQNGQSLIYSAPLSDYEQLFIIPKGEAIQQFTDVKKFLRYPQISPDGGKIVLETRDDFFGKSQIMIMDSLSKKMDALLTDNTSDIYPRWSPDGNFISFLSQQASCPDNYTGSCFDLSIVSAKSKQIIKTFSGPIEDYFPVSWSPDSNEIIFFRWENGFYHLINYDLDKNVEIEVQNSGTDDEMGVWSSKSNQLAFARAFEDSQTISEICILENQIATCIDQKGSEITDIFWIDDQTILYGLYDKTGDATTVKVLDTTTQKNMALGVYSGYLDSFETLK